MDPVLTCTQFAQDGTTCTTTVWVQPPPPFFPPMSVADGETIGFAIMSAMVIIAASKLVRRA